MAKARQKRVLRSITIASILAVLIAGTAAAEAGGPFKDCGCRRIKLVCSNRLIEKTCGGTQAVACADSTNCIMYLSEEVCAHRKFENKQYALDDLEPLMGFDGKGMKQQLEAIKWEDPADVKRAEKLADRLHHWIVLLHEFTHLCVSKAVPGVRDRACSEWGAYNVNSRIYKVAAEKLCTDRSLHAADGKVNAFCVQLCNNAFNIDLSSQWFNCLCPITQEHSGLFEEWLPAEDCCGCYSRCLGDFMKGSENMPGFCRELLAKPENRKAFEEQAKDICRQIAIDSPYSCKHLSRGRYSVPEACKK